MVGDRSGRFSDGDLWYDEGDDDDIGDDDVVLMC